MSNCVVGVYVVSRPQSTQSRGVGFCCENRHVYAVCVLFVCAACGFGVVRTRLFGYFSYYWQWSGGFFWGACELSCCVCSVVCPPDALHRQMGKKAKEIFTTVISHHPSIFGLPHDLPPSVARQQRKIPDPWPSQAAGALKIALLGAHGEHVPRGALKELDHSTLLLRLLSVL